MRSMAEKVAILVWFYVMYMTFIIQLNEMIANVIILRKMF
jgi:hypothetical protein